MGLVAYTTLYNGAWRLSLFRIAVFHKLGIHGWQIDVWKLSLWYGINYGYALYNEIL